MEKLFARNNIGFQPIVDQDGLDINFAYTDKLLSLNVLIEFYTAVLDDSEENYEEETAVFAITYTKERSYSFALFVTSEVVGPLILFRIIADAIKFIEHSDKNSLLDDLEEIATGHTTSDDVENPRDRKEFYENELWKFNTALGLIEEKKRSKQ
jgi:hypothetical protein